jgi:prolyl oligopeptidase
MEDPDAKETKEFVNQQNAVTEPFLEKCTAKQQIYDRYK